MREGEYGGRVDVDGGWMWREDGCGGRMDVVGGWMCTPVVQGVNYIASCVCTHACMHNMCQLNSCI